MLLVEKRVIKIFYTFIILFFLLLVRLSYIQIVQGDYFTARVLHRETKTVALEDFSRGQILDRNLRSMTQSIQLNQLIVFPQIIDKPDILAEKLAEILKIDQSELLPLLKQKPGILNYRLSPDQVSSIRQLNCPGALVLPVNFRYGPEPLAAQVVGYLGRVNSYQEISSLSNRSKKAYQFDDWVGRTGLESYYEQELKAMDAQGYARLFVDARTEWLRGLGVESDVRHVDNGRQNLVTTIDSDIQRIVESVMDAHIKNGAVVVMDVSTGDILAMASRPNYNPKPQKIMDNLSNPEALLDQCTMLFPPGSIMKVVVAAAALAEGVATTGDTFYCRGEKDEPVRCWYAPGHGEITFEQAFAQSCNPVFVHVANKLGADKLISYARSFGLDNQKIIGYPVTEDQRQNLDLISAPYNLVNSSLGQGPVLATPVQLTAMMNTIANGGVYVKPRLVKETLKGDGSVALSFPSEAGSQVISPDVDAQLQQLLTLVTTGGIGKEAYIKGCGSAGKTGSAQVESSDGHVDAWFCGYAPLDHPRYVMTVLIKGGVSGSQTAAPVFKKIMENILNFYVPL